MRQPEIDLQRVRSYIQRTRAQSPTTRLPAERDLAETLGLTRNRLRGSLRKLASEGVIWRGVGKGTFLGEPPPIASERDLAKLVERTSPREVFQARLLFEPELARLAAYRATIQGHAQMRECVAKMKGVRDYGVWGTWDELLHRTIAESAGSVVLLSMFDTLQSTQKNSNWGRLRERLQTAARRKDATSEHEQIVDAICNRDPDCAARLMTEHIARLERIIFTQ
jgi:DNA-binding FadR family transcriptional regulator